MTEQIKLTKQEKAALAMHEIMKREQQRYHNRIKEQAEISRLSDDELKKIVSDFEQNLLKALEEV